jgi:dihydropteroate synthase
MGVLNVSPESFSGDGVDDVDAAVAQGLRCVQEGADIIDVGGQSTRPVYSARVESGVSGGAGLGYAALSPEEEMRRVIPVIERLVTETDAPVSIDTYKASVARAAVRAGASLINDVWGLKRDPDLARVAAEEGVPLVLMHNQEGTGYREDIVKEVIASLRASIAAAVAAGVPLESIIVDPGFGFGKTVAHNLEVLRRLREIADALGRPLLLGTSRKSTIGRVLDLPVDQRVEGTAATVAIGIANGADIVRVHDVRAMTRVARMTDAIVRETPPHVGA